MIEIINNRIILIDDKANMVEIDDEALTELYKNIKKILGDITLDENLIKPVEDIYYYIVEKIYTLPEYAQGVSLKEKPKAKLLIAFNKFFFEKIYENARRYTK
jgi:hypothetical protein